MRRGGDAKERGQETGTNRQPEDQTAIDTAECTKESKGFALGDTLRIGFGHFAVRSSFPLFADAMTRAVIAIRKGLALRWLSSLCRSSFAEEHAER